MKKIGLYLLLSIYIYALPAGINKIIKKSKLSRNEISIYIKQVGKNGKVIAFLNANTFRTPASVIKVLSTYASVLKLGFDYRIPTKIYTTGSLTKGTLHGDLIVKAFGDPTLGSQDLKEIVSHISKKGIRKITGNIVIDRSYFKVGTKNTSGFDENRYSAYNAMPDAMMFNERVSTVYVNPKRNSVIKKTVDGSYKVVNRLKRVNKPCRGKYSWIGASVDNKSVTPTLYIKGRVSKRCGTRNVCKVLTKPYNSFYYALREGLKRKGIHIGGRLSLRKTPRNATLLYTHYSESLEKIISKTAKKSNNLYARHLLLILGAKMYGTPATLYKGRKAVKAILKNKHALHDKRLNLDNGSGLSRTAKLSAKLLADMFDNAYERYGQRWLNTLSIAGRDGTIRQRFKGSVAQNRAWMKTGTLKHTKNIGGYVKSRQGILYTAVILVKTRKGLWKASGLQNDIIKWLVRYKNSRLKVSKKKLTIHTKPKKSTFKHKKYYIQAGVFHEKPMPRFLRQVKRLGFPYRVKKMKNYKVLIGAFSSKQKAKKALFKVQDMVNKQSFLIQL